MKDSRSASQILYGLLPEQTIDVQGGVWKVSKWRTTPVHDIDTEALTNALISAAEPWEATGRDGGFIASLRAGRQVRVESLDRERGILLDLFPREWMCRNCNRLHKSPNAKCECGNSRHGQLPFVLFHDACGTIREPYFPRCRIHNQAKLELPGTTNLYEIKLSCPVCNVRLPEHFLRTKCDCGELGHRGKDMDFTVHRSASVYTPRGVVIVNPPSKIRMQRLMEVGGRSAALTWMAEGMGAGWVDKIEVGRAAALRKSLLDQGFSTEIVERMVQESGLPDKPGASLQGPPSVIAEAESEATSIALALYETRKTIDGMLETAEGTQADTYSNAYPKALALAGLQRIDLVEKFPVLTGQYGYTRGDHEPGSSRLRTHTLNDGTHIVYGDLAATEALVLRLNPVLVAKWLSLRSHDVKLSENPRIAYEHILSAMSPNLETSVVAVDLQRLIHSFSHRMVRQVSFYAGIDRNALSELLFPTALAFVTYAVPKGDFVLGGLQAMYEYDLHTVLNKVVHDEHRCALDPGCASNPKGAACAVCLHLGEPSCRKFNTLLDRKTLFGSKGYFQIVN